MYVVNTSMDVALDQKRVNSSLCNSTKTPVSLTPVIPLVTKTKNLDNGDLDDEQE